MYLHIALTEIASNKDGIPSGFGGLLASALGMVIAAVAVLRIKTGFWTIRSRKYSELIKSITERDASRITANTDLIKTLAAIREPRDFLLSENLESRRKNVELDELRRTENEFLILSKSRDQLHLSEIERLFKRARLSFYSFLSIALVTSGILLYGAYLTLAGHIASGVVVALTGAIPGSFSVGLYRISHSADQRADLALSKLDREVEREALVNRTFFAARRLVSEETREAGRILATLRAAFPEASADQLAALLDAVSNHSTINHDHDMKSPIPES